MKSSKKYSLPLSDRKNRTCRPVDFDFVLECLEVFEHFALLSHWVDPGVPGEVVDEEHVISASAECSGLCRSPYIGMDYVE